MYLSSVKIKNFRGYGENINSEDNCYIFDDLDAPLVIFKGYNGFGKTSFYEAIEWCLTDRVYRLEKLYEDKTYQAHELKRSHYLKFYHPTHGEISEREIFVELTFNNGFKVVRKTKSNVLRTTERDNTYQSTVFMGYKDVKTATNKEVIHEFIYNSKDSNAFFRTHMLGQENINDFLRHNSPPKRREIFMELLQESRLNESFTKINKYTTNSNSLLRKFNKHKQSKDKYQKDQTEISEFIRNLKFDDMSSYLESIRKQYLLIKPLMKENLVSDILSFHSLINFGEIKLKSSVTLLEGFSFKQQETSTIVKGLIAKKEDLERTQKRIERLSLLKEANMKLIRSNHADRLLKSSLKDLQIKLESHDAKFKELEKRKAMFDEIVNRLLSYKDSFISLPQNINFEELSIKNSYRNDINNEMLRYSSFFADYQLFIQELPFPSKINIDLDWYDNIQKLFEELQLRMKNELDKLNSIQGLKSELSTLNEQYQKALTSVKQFISSNPEKISECPVCLNEDFPNPKYSNDSIESWNPSLPMSEKILVIIDSTFASGNKKIDTFSHQESEVLGDLEKTKKDIKDSVLQKIFDNLNTIRTSFVNQYIELEKHLKNILQKINKDIDQESDSKTLVSQQIERIEESIIVLYGENYEFSKISEIKLKDIIMEKDSWLEKNKEKLDFLKGNVNPALIDMEISLLNENTVLSKTDNLFEDIQVTTKKIEYLNDLLQKVSEILKHKIPVEYASSLADYDQLGFKINQLSSQIEVISNYIDQVELFQTQLSESQSEIIEKRLENHPVVGWVYETINPHPFYKSLHIKNNERGTNFMGETQHEDKIELYLDQMFSAAQLNILALSIFLGLGLTQEYSKLQQMFLDDPIQSLDDVNILAFIDVLRAIMDSKYNEKRIIISTHNEDFAQLLAIKMRNRKVTQYSIEGYTEEGPKIKKL